MREMGVALTYVLAASIQPITVYRVRHTNMQNARAIAHAPCAGYKPSPELPHELVALSSPLRVVSPSHFLLLCCLWLGPSAVW